ncbi:hypothetical protein [Campylobacter sp.]|uniref:hypothetical protein n=1 Tax=Campylobacter sp. TaxID=205 RepID=UPI002AA76384|nr:hypothetical protein [Campylobacter sp.]MCI6661380.1 hypothetical protein [Campylobacter sp.]
MNNPALENVKNLAFLSNESYKTAVNTVQKGKEKEQMSFNQPLKNPATNSSFEVVAQVNDDTTGFSGTVFKDPVSGEYTIAFRGTEIGNEKISA